MTDHYESPPRYIDSAGQRIAVRQQPGSEPAIVWLGGFKSDMRSTKAAALASWAEANGAASLLFD
ncbi:MAG: alpha/beta hydrolase, partial [Beijerinckiaceae bacterium]|nr:alpha/beta hydrolase [Beijerinckiaceae bacterium]